MRSTKNTPELVELTLHLPAKLVEKIEATADARGVDLDTYARVALSGAANIKVKYFDLQTKFTFGNKYRGEITENIIRVDPSYIEWCIDEVAGFELSPRATKLLKQMGRVSAIVDED